jgi:hypothetical protein
MHGTINVALQGFLKDNYGAELWAEVRRIAKLPEDGFEAMVSYDHALTIACVEAAVKVLGKSPNAFLEDLGTFLVIHPNLEPLRRLLRFGGGDFVEFLHSLEEWPDRARLALPELEVPEIRLIPQGPGEYVISARWALPGIAPLLSGTLRAMADDYGALVMLSLAGIEDGEERLRVQVVDAAFAEGRSFSLVQAEP